MSATEPVRVLLVDDSPGFRALVRAIFSRHKAIVLVAATASAEEAIELLKNDPVDLVILDIELAGMDGLAAIPHLRDVAADIAILIVSLSAQRNSAISAKALSLGADDYLPKPIQPQEVASFAEELPAKVRSLADRVLERGKPPQPLIKSVQPGTAMPAIPAPPPIRLKPVPGSRKRSDPIRVMLVDDSLTFCKLLAALLAQDPQILVVAVAASSEEAIGLLQAIPVDVVILDIEMPGLSGIDALPRLLEVAPTVRIIMASILTQENAAISLKALAMGASDYLPKPLGPADSAVDGAFYRDLVGKVKALAAAGSEERSEKIALMKRGAAPPLVLAIGCSTGGPQALTTLLQMVRWPIGVPVLVTQHMPQSFTQAFAENIGAKTGMPCHEARQGEILVPDTIYVAPGGEHLLIDRVGQALVVRLSQEPPENFCRPSVDPMLRSLSKAAQGRVLALILTGMGSDGLAGARTVVEAGGTVMAQDQATSVVWGMPGAVATAGLCAAVLPLAGLADQVNHLMDVTYADRQRAL